MSAKPTRQADRLLIALIIGAVLLSAWAALQLSGLLTERLMRQDAIATQRLIQTSVDTLQRSQHLTTEQLKTSETGDALMAAVLHQPGVFRVTGWSLNGENLWSSDPRFDQALAPDARITASLRGKLSVERGHSDTVINGAAVNGQPWYSAMTLPLQLNGKLAAAIAVDKYPGNLSTSLIFLNGLIGLGALAASTLIILSLLSLRLQYTVEQLIPEPLQTPAAPSVSRPLRHRLVAKLRSLRTASTSVVPLTTPPPNWKAATAALAASILAPCLLGIGLLAYSGVDPDSDLAKASATTGSFSSALLQVYAPFTPSPKAPKPTAIASVATAAQPLAQTPVLPASGPMTAESAEPPVRLSEADTATTEAELMFWDSIRSSNNPAFFQAYLDQYPSGDFAPIAQILVEPAVAKQAHMTETPATALTPPTDTIEQLLERGWKAFSRRSLTVPSDDNAAHWAEMVLRLEPNNSDAKNLLAMVIDTYLNWTASALRAGMHTNAQDYLQKTGALLQHADPEQTEAVIAFRHLLTMPCTPP